MDNMSLPSHTPIAIGEDKSAAQIIAHAGKLTHNVRHIATKTQARLQEQHLCHGRVSFHHVSSAHKYADHFTKASPFATLSAHCMTMMGYSFLNAGHRALAHPFYPVL